MVKVLFVTLSFVLLSQSLGPDFLKEQRRYERFRTAEKEKLEIVKELFRAKNLKFPSSKIFIRIFKKDKELELWTYSGTQNKYILVKTYNVCASSGVLGPKRQEGDLQVPEGVYFIDRFNPVSNFYLSLGINYPNNSDKILGVKSSLGGNIFIHGNCVTIGCVPIEDEFIKELYLICVYAKNGGEEKIPVHIFPTRFDKDGEKYLKDNFNAQVLQKFWKNLKTVYESFEADKNLKKISVNKRGEYIL